MNVGGKNLDEEKASVNKKGNDDVDREVSGISKEYVDDGLVGQEVRQDEERGEDVQISTQIISSSPWIAETQTSGSFPH